MSGRLDSFLKTIAGGERASSLGQEHEASKRLKRADEARDARDWRMAAAHYQLYLEARPSAAPIWIQFGHALKEMGDRDYAETVYRRGVALAPDVADNQLQLGHILKLNGKVREAISAYERAEVLDPSAFDVRMELKALGAPRESSSRAQSPRFLLDLSDVFAYLWHHDTVTGIQRVQLGLAEALLGRTDLGRDMAFLTNAADNSGYVEVDEFFLGQLLEELRRPEVSHDALKRVITATKQSAPSYQPLRGDLILILGAFWVIQNIVQRVAFCKQRGVLVAVLIHDIIPLTHPQYCEEKTIENFSECFPVVSIADLVLTVSEHTGRELARYLKDRGRSDVLTRTLRPAHLTWISSARDDQIPSRKLRRLLKKEYVLYVSTIEVRKNHLYLFRIWERMIKSSTQPPNLIFVGRPGWRVTDFMARLEATEGLGGRIHVIHGLSDAELALLYKGALFTVFPSLEEGWGLPVGESLVFGRPCVASTSSSIPEVGGAFVDYLDPLDVESGYEAVSRLINDSEHRARSTAKIQKEFAPRKWPQVADELMAHLRETILAPNFDPAPIRPPVLSGGRLYELGCGKDKMQFIESGMNYASALIFDHYWFETEDFGRWLNGRRGALRFGVQGESDKPVTVLLRIPSVTWFHGEGLSVRVNDKEFKLPRLVAGQTSYFAFETIAEDGEVEIVFELAEPVEPAGGESRRLSVGLGAVGYALRSDLSQRLDLMEATLFQRSHAPHIVRFPS